LTVFNNNVELPTSGRIKTFTGFYLTILVFGLKITLQQQITAEAVNSGFPQWLRFNTYMYHILTCNIFPLSKQLFYNTNSKTCE